MYDETAFLEKGYFTQKFENTSALTELKNTCIEHCRERFGSAFSSLENYHLLDVSPKEHDDFQFELYSLINKEKFHRQFVADNMKFFNLLFGQDIDIQTNTYLRIARPNEKSDNIGMHRDTDYGNSAYEISFTLPLVDQAAGSGLNVIPKSHLLQEHVTKQVKRVDVEKGTKKNEMGFLYAPKIPVNLDQKQLECVCLPFGDGLGFTLGLIHGQICNTSNMTRWSVDFRLKNSFHPVTKNLKDSYYSNFSRSVVSKLAAGYYQNNFVEQKDLVTHTSVALGDEP